MNTSDRTRKFVIVTGASTGIGYELAKCCARDRYDLLIAADEPEIVTAVDQLSELGVRAQAVETDLSATEGVDELYGAANGRPVDALLANAGLVSQAVYNGTKALIDSFSFSFALRAELKGSRVTVTCLMPGATEEANLHHA